MASLLDLLRQSTQVDCDTMDSTIAADLGPFVDCTSNQAIAFFELTRPVSGQALLHHQQLIDEAIVDANQGWQKEFQGDATFEEFVVEILMIKLQLRFLPNTTGYVHVQTNPKLSYSTKATVTNAERLVAVFAKSVSKAEDANRICIKIPATWEGLQACRTLEDKGITTLATTMFCMEQAALAADAQCTYIAPYVNELKVHFEAGYVDQQKAFDFCREAQTFYNAQSSKTRVLAASLTSVEEVMQLAGVDHITISAALLKQLAGREASSWHSKVGDYFAQGPAAKSLAVEEYTRLFRDESAWRLAFTRSGFGSSEGKIIQAINYFSDFQEKLEALVRQNVG